MVELDTIIQQLYKKQLLGEIADDLFKKMCDRYEELTSKIINELIDKIIIHQPISRGKNMQIKLKMHY